MKFDKTILIQNLISDLTQDRAALMAAAQSTYEAAVGEESQPENEYDTRALEASYLAGAQAKRVAEIDEQLALLNLIRPRSFDSTAAIAATAIVSVDLDGEKSWIFLLPKVGGRELMIQGVKIQTVTPLSPLGEALLGLKVGDSATVEVGDESRDYEILDLQ